MNAGGNRCRTGAIRVMRAALCATLGAFSFPHLATAADFACPQIATNPLTSVEVYDGPFSDNAILAPDRFKGSEANGSSKWDVAYVFEAGRELNVICRYRNQKKAENIHSAAKLKSCEFRTNTKTGASFSCK